jgi:hypothetical protein
VGTDAGASPVITSTAMLPNAFADIAYAQTLTATGGTPPYAWTLSAGSLPAGLSLDAAGALTGTPLTTGTAGFTVQVADAVSAASTQVVTLTVLHDVDLSWNASPTSSVTYSLYRATGGAAYVPLATALTTTRYTDLNVSSGTTYAYQVTAVNSAGESPPSTSVTLTIP